MGNFSCFVTLVNNTSYDLTLAGSTADNGSFSLLPQEIPAGQTGTIELDDPPIIPEGSQGSCLYQVGGQQVFVNMSFSDPYSGSNTASGYISGSGPVNEVSLSFEGASENPSGWQPGGVPSGGHPVFVNYTLQQTST